MNKIRVIDLLVKIANGEEVPKKFKFAQQIFIRNETSYEDEDGDDIFESIFNDFSNINDEIEIIEEDKPIETVNDFTANVGAVDESNVEEYIHILFEQETILYFKINEIIDKLNKLEEGNK